jgi:Zn-dependent protease with chaperone function
MGNEITINLLIREELDPKLYDIISVLRDKFEIKGRTYVQIKEEDRTCPSDFCGGISPTLLIDFKSGKKRLRDLVMCENTLVIKRRGLKKINPNKQPTELTAILAHEFSHIFNKDQLIWGAAVALIFFGFICLGGLFWLITLSNLFPLVGIIILAATFFLIYIVVTGKRYYRLRRDTEARCDRDVVTITQNADALVRGLKIISGANTNVKNTIWIKVKRRWYNFFGGTHPPISERIQYIESLKMN